ncbi:MAG: T9SS type A sorting domain-containing protein [Fibrobacteres bacterium]|nr:T9SS type A sorting domain-containing protein [Fibrobacterota bacterium]
MYSRFAISTLFLIIFLTSSSVFCGPVEDLKPGEWYEVPNSHLASVPPGGNVIAPWSGGAFDTKRNQLIVWGGGHGDYAGNEVYAFNLDSLKWSRLTNPSSIAGVTGCLPIMPDSQPTSRHTYCGMDYVESEDRVFAGGGFIWPCANGDPWTWFFDYTLNKWVKGANLGFGSRAFAAYDPSTGHLWCNGGTGLNEYDPTTKTWTRRYLTVSGQILAIDPVNHWLVGLARGTVRYTPIAGNTSSGGIYNTSGDTSVINPVMNPSDYCAPGFVWDPIINKFVSWSGGANVYILDQTTHAFTKLSPAASNKVIPTAAAAQGTYGRFRYSPKSNVYVVVNSKDENVFIYRLADKLTNMESISAKSLKSNLSITPNPFNGTAAITFSLAGINLNSKLEIFSSDGRLVKYVALKNQNGLFIHKWNAVDKNGALLPNGLYLVRITSAGAIYQNKAVLAR